ncbi:MAG TPA: FG-GAP-like repeat-containing protein [Pyrinomonadaceae bacterium]
MIAGCAPDASAADCTTPTFAPPTVYGTGAARRVAVADFNKDGKLDFASLNSGEFGSVSLYLGDGAGAFTQAGGLIPLGNTPVGIAAGDFDGDGFPDLVVANDTYVDGEGTVLLNRGLAFDVRRPLSWSSASSTHGASTSVAVADLNLDGKLDAVLTNLNSGGRFGFSRLLVALGDGTGYFPLGGVFQVGGSDAFPLHVVARDFNGDGKPDLAVAQPYGASLVIFNGDGAGNFRFGNSYFGGGVYFIEPGDFNSDNKVDLALQTGNTSITILLGDGAGDFSATSISTGGVSPGNLTTGDFNGDGKIDLATNDQGAGSILILTGDGAGNFNPSAAYNTGAASPTFIQAADLNADGKSDLVVAHESGRSVSAMLNNCGTGDAAPRLNFSAAAYTTRDEQTSTAFVAVNRYGSLAGAATVNYATSDGTAVSPSDYKATSGTLSFADGEASKNFTVEIINDTVQEPTETLNLTLANPTGAAVLGTLGAATLNILDDDFAPTLSVSDGSLIEGDFHARSMLFDLRLSAPINVELKINYATSDLSATAGVDYAAASGTIIIPPGQTGSAPIPVVINGDTLGEINETFLLTLSTPDNPNIGDAQGVGVIIEDDSACPSASFAAPSDFDAGANPSAIAAGDFNGDGKPDVAIAHLDSAQVSLLLGNASGGFAAAKNIPATASNGIAAGDLNHDGDLDLVTSGGSILLGDGAGNFAPAANVNLGQLPYSVKIADLNLDGKPDLAATNTGAGTVSVLHGDGAGGFGARAAYVVGTSPHHLTTADFNGDGKPDLAVTNSNSHNVSVLLGDGSGAFGAAVNFASGQNPQGIEPGDFNRDGRVDLAVANEGSNSVSVLFGNGAGAFAAPTNIGVGMRPVGIVVADFNGDRQADVAVANFTNDLAIGSVSVLFGDGAGHFTQHATFPTRLSPTALVAGDFNGDAKLDVVVVNRYSRSVSLLINSCSAPTPATVQFEVGSNSLIEGDGRAAIRVTRKGDASGFASVDYNTSDTDTFTVACSDTANNNGGAYARCDFGGVSGRLDFAAGEWQKTIFVPIVDDGHDEEFETFRVLLSNLTGAVFGTTRTTTITIHDNDAAGAPNPIFTAPFFVRQHYLDFLSREPEVNEPWSGVLARCPNVNNTDARSPSAGCDRIHVSQSFFRSLEFQLKGAYAFRFYRLAFNRLPEYTEIATDMSFVSGVTPEEVYARKAQLSRLFTARPEFQTAYGGLSNSAFVAALLGRYQITQINTPDPEQPDGTTKVLLTQAGLVNRLDSNFLTRAQVFRAVADSDEASALEFDNAFVAMQYYGYLRRKPEAAGYEAWLGVLRRGDIRTMVDGFMNSPEYKLRFGGL